MLECILQTLSWGILKINLGTISFIQESLLLQPSRLKLGYIVHISRPGILQIRHSTFYFAFNYPRILITSVITLHAQVDKTQAQSHSTTNKSQQFPKIQNTVLTPKNWYKLPPPPSTLAPCDKVIIHMQTETKTRNERIPSVQCVSYLPCSSRRCASAGGCTTQE